ncbi:probable 3-deoxy-D-manno-octulosonic acid transferase, mitochondrial isoform X2 [Papaver somniferum]|uniref:probable 3-deoxy-D-manno-octulosonic acid transferase, mitochondrial isoform X2 n=1 Tax=Papaver somniferum TaxID=3469 RepID=UPI000E7036B4|nr:probable 3-deoxy-D-manno-octulosonic acid transferase, mitochondrial isoform X2 [Papaver somniferum]
MMIDKGKVIYMAYRAVSYSLSPFIYIHLQWRRFRGLEHPIRWRERLGHPSINRPPGPFLWFHAVSLGEGLAAIPVIRRCIQQKPNLTILMTTTTTSAFEVIKDRLPNDVLYQYAPLDTPSAMDDFLDYWNPVAVMLMESELWPNLVFGATKKGITMALLNARMSSKSFHRWSTPIVFPLISSMLSKFSLIAPLSNVEAIRYQLLQAPPFIINFAGDLKYAVNNVDISMQDNTCLEDLQLRLGNRPVWMASSIHKGEDEVVVGVHRALMQVYPNVITIIVPRHPQLGQQMALELRKDGFNVVLRSCKEKILPSTNFYIVDTLGSFTYVFVHLGFNLLLSLKFRAHCLDFPIWGELRSLYRIIPVAVIGGSFLPGLAGHNVSEAAAAGCAVLTGRYVGHFSRMILEMQQINPLSVMQTDLLKKLLELFSNANTLETHRMAAKQAFHALSNGVVSNIWNLLNIHVIQKALPPEIK